MSRDPYFLVIGIDFGTSFTKVVVQSHGLDQGEARVLSVDGCWLIPSVIGIVGDNVSGPLTLPMRGAIPYLKMMASGKSIKYFDSFEYPDEIANAINRYDHSQIINALLAFYFANIIAATRDFIRNETPWRDFYFLEQSEDFLCYHLCVPTVYQADTDVNRMFRAALCTGYMLSEHLDGDMHNTVEIADLVRYCNESRDFVPGIIERDCCKTYPEVAAAIQTVMRSQTAEDGIYMTFDIGAGTVDMNVFNRNTRIYSDEQIENDEDPNDLYYYATAIKALGAARIYERRSFNPFSSFDMTFVADDWSLAPIRENELMQKLHSEIHALFYRAQMYQKNLGNKPGHRTFDTTRVYAWGGGLRHSRYEDELICKLNELMHPERVINRLPLPTKLRVGESMDFDRLAIAYGLSFPYPNLEKITLPDELTKWKEREDIQEGDEEQFPEDYWTNPKYQDWY